MAFLQNLRRWLGFRDTVPAAQDVSDLRRRVEALLEADDGPALATLLGAHREMGKVLIRQYEAEVRAAAEPDRAPMVRRITALVGVYAQALGDTEPLSWFRPPDAPEQHPAAVALEQAQQAFAAGDFAQADAVAAEGLRAIDQTEAATPPRDALESALFAVRGGAAVNLGHLEDALERFGFSLERARSSGEREPVAAAQLNLVDLHTRRDSFEADDPALAATVDAATGTRYEDVAGKLLVERGVALIRRGDLESAVRVFDQAIAFRPQWPFPYYQRAWARFLQGDSGGALEDYREVARGHPVFFTVQREIRCLENVAAGRLPIEAYRSFCAIRGQVTRDAKEVATAAERIVERHPDFAPGWVLLAEALLGLGQLADARVAAGKALEHDPDPDTAAAALFAEWNLARAAGEPTAVDEAANRLRSAYSDQPAAEIIRRLGNHPDQNRSVRWTWALDGTLKVEDVSPAGQTPPPPAPPE